MALLVRQRQAPTTKLAVSARDSAHRIPLLRIAAQLPSGTEPTFLWGKPGLQATRLSGKDIVVS